MQRFSAECPDRIRVAAKRAYDYCRDHNKCELVCEDVVVKVTPLDTVEVITLRWRMYYNFFGLTLEDRRKIYHLYIVRGLPSTTVQKKTGLTANSVASYIRQKGWSRSLHELREQKSTVGDLHDRMNSWDYRHNASWAARANGVEI